MAHSHGRGNFITITHFINPHLFWYQKVDVSKDGLEEIAQLETKLAAQYNNTMKFPTKLLPQEGDKVAVHYLSWKKYIRAEVLQVNRGDEIFVWALDYGFPFKTKSIHLRRLETCNAGHIDHVRRGGLVNILSAEREFDFMKRCPVMVSKDSWHKRACDSLEKLLLDAASLTFVEHFPQLYNKEGKLHFWGELEITDHQGNRFQATEYLMGIDFAVASGAKFTTICKSLATTQVPVWLSNNNCNKYKDNTYNSAVEERHVNRNDLCDEFAKRKVEDWCLRNTREVNDKSLDNLEHSGTVPLIDDISFDDSVSVKYQNAYKKHAVLKGKTHERQAAVEASRGSQSTSQQSAYLSYLSEDALFALGQNVELAATHPTSVAQTLSHKSNDSHSNVSGISLRKQKLLEIRKKVVEETEREAASSASGGCSQVQDFQDTDDLAVSMASDANSKVSVGSSRSQHLRDLCRKYASCQVSAEVETDDTKPTQNKDAAKTSKHRDNLLKLRSKQIQGNLDEILQTRPTEVVLESKHFENASVVSVASSRTIHLRNIRKKIQEENKSEMNVKPFGKIEIPEKQNYDPTDFTASSKNKYKEYMQNELEARKIVPAGYDLSNLNRYRDEKNHWHRKSTTRHDHLAHDADFLMEERLLNSTKNSSTSTADTAEIESANDLPFENNDSLMSNQNFRHTRSHTDKFKDVDDEQHEKHLLDTNVPELKAKSLLQPLLNSEINLENTQKHSTESQTTSSAATAISVATTNSTPSSQKPQRGRKHRELKSPAVQKDKLDAILRRAKHEKKLGNPDILDFDSDDSYGELESTGGDSNSTDGAGTSLTDISNSASDTKTSNKRALVENRLQQLGGTHKERQYEETPFGTGRESATLVYNTPSTHWTEIEGECTLKTNFMDSLVLPHSKVPVRAAEKLSDVYLPQEIHDEMVQMRVTKVFRIQAYGWPHLLRGNSLFVVNPSRSGKTWCYLPPICSLVAYRVQSNLLPDTYGPVAVVLVPSSTHAEHVHKYCRRLLANYKGKVSVVVSFGVRNMVAAKIQLLNGCGILIVTPANCLRLLQDNKQECLFDSERLHYLVVDDMDLLISRSLDSFQKAVKALYSLRKRTDSSNLQVVVTSREWDVHMVPMIRCSGQPLLLIGDFLEAAVYGKAAISIKLCSSEEKIATIISHIEKHPPQTSRLIIFCTTSAEVEYVARQLTAAGHVCICYTDNSAAAMHIVINEWKKLYTGQVFVCSDDAFPELQIQNVHSIIHYSMAMSWTKFTNRFSAMAHTYENFVANDFASSTSSDTTSTCNNSAAKPTAIVLLDESNSQQLPRFYDFMRKHNQLKYIHPDILGVMKRVLLQREEGRILRDTALCPYVLEFGDCDESYCSYRHNLTAFDAVSKTDDLPSCGDLRILILQVFSPTHYVARLLQHKPAGSKQWHEVRQSDKAGVFAMQLNLHYMQIDNLKQHWPLQLHDLCVCKRRDNFERVRIVELPQVKHTHVVQKVKLTVELIDFGGTKPIDSDELFILEERFKDFPTQAVDIRLRGVVPYDSERTWDSKATKTVQKWIMGDIGKRDCVHVNIDFALARTIWVRNVIVMEQLPTVGQYVYRVNLKRSLLEREFAVMCSKKGQHLQDVAQEVGLLEPSQDDSTATDLERGVCAASDSSSLIKFSSNEDDTFESADRSGKEDKEKEELEEHKEEMVENWDDITEELQPNEVYLPLPRNASNTNTEKKSSQTKLHFKEQWIEMPLNRVISVEIGDEKENGNWGEIFLQLVDEEHVQLCEQLLQLIKQYIAKLKELPEKASASDGSSLQPGQSCIVKYDGLYLRAKLISIYGEVMQQCIYRFLLCDYACFVTVTESELYKDFFYETTKEIVEFMPYQAVCCTLAGIKLDRFAKRCMVTKSYLFANAVEEGNANKPVALAGIDIKCYKILLYECDNPDDLQEAVLFNKMLVREEAATLDEQSKQLLELSVDNELTDSCDEEQLLTQLTKTTDKTSDKTGAVCSFQELLQCIQNSFELDAEEAALKKAVKDTGEWEKSRQALRETKAICAAGMERQKELVGDEKFPKNIMDKEEPTKIALKKTIQTENEEQTNKALKKDNSTVIESPPPPLKVLHKRPQTTWYETDCLIVLSIHAPDVDDYYLQVTPDTLVFGAYIHDEEHALVLNLLGTVQPESVSHEVRGLYVIVRLVKSIFMKWPRLLQQPYKYTWLTYDLNAIDAAELEHLLPQQRLLMVMDANATPGIKYANDSSEDSDDEKNIYQTYTPIVNSEDIHDPTEEFF